jgi:hypothetical protein
MWPFRKPTAQASEATAARIRAQHELERTRRETRLYRELAESLRELRERNNFAAAIETSFRGGRR